MLSNFLLLSYFQFVSMINIVVLFPVLSISLIFTNKIKTYFINSYFIGMAFIIAWLYDVKLYIKNDNLIKNILKKNKKIFIQNHQTEFDFLILILLFSQKPTILFDILIKSIMTQKVYNFLPGIGLANILNDGIMIGKNKSQNLEKMNNLKLENGEFVYIFPEGFLSHKENKIKSDLYCKENNLEIPKYTLYPKTTGIEVLFNNNNDIESLFSLAVKFDNLEPFDKAYRIYNTNIPKNIYIELNEVKINGDIKKITIETFENINKSFENKDYSNYKLYTKNYNQLFHFIFQIYVSLFTIYYIIKYKIIIYLTFLTLISYYIHI